MVREVIPHDLDAERAVLGSMLLYANARTDACQALVAEDFHTPLHGRIFSALLALSISGKPLELAALAASVDGVDLPKLMALQGDGSYSWKATIRLLADLSARRRMLAASSDLAEQARDLGVPFDETFAAWARATDQIAAPDVDPECAEEIVGLRAGVESGWVIPGTLRRRERVIVTGGEGSGKSFLGRWVAMSVAAGRAPFPAGTENEIPSVRSLIVDLENEAGDIGDSARRVAPKIGYSAGCHARSRPQGIDLTQARDVRWLTSLVDGESPALVVVGPLYKMYRGAEGRSKASEEAAEIVAEVLDDLRVAFDCALWIEAHSPHGEGGNRDGGRPRGSSLWLGWPNFGRFMERQNHDHRLVRLKPWRGDRHRQRSWPWGIRETPTVPWVPVWKDPRGA